MTLSYGKSLLPSTVGFDRLLSTFEEFDTLQFKPQTYPPYNLIRENDFNWTIEVALSGFKREEIDITYENCKLIISGAIAEEKEKREYVHRGIAKRSFSHKFILAETVVVKGAELQDGTLVVKLENVIPDERKPRKIQIGNNAENLLTQ
jgi:molecular chaperone IbpA